MTCRAPSPKSSACPRALAHPQDVTHYMGLYFMHMRGAKLINEVVLK